MPRIASIVLGVWLVAQALMSLINLRFTGSSTIMDGLALVAGVLFLIRI